MAQQTPSLAEPLLRPKAAEYKAEGFDDPFKEEAEGLKQEEKKEERKPLPELIIQGIVWGGGFPQAIINNKVVRVGDTIAEARVVDISNKGLILSFQGRQYNLSSPATVNINNSFGKKPEGGINEK